MAYMGSGYMAKNNTFQKYHLYKKTTSYLLIQNFFGKLQQEPLFIFFNNLALTKKLVLVVFL